MQGLNQYIIIFMIVTCSLVAGEPNNGLHDDKYKSVLSEKWCSEVNYCTRAYCCVSIILKRLRNNPGNKVICKRKGWLGSDSEKSCMLEQLQRTYRHYLQQLIGYPREILKLESGNSITLLGKLIIEKPYYYGVRLLLTTYRVDPNEPCFVNVYHGPKLLPMVPLFMNRDSYLVALLLQHGADVNKKYDGRPLIHRLVEDNDISPMLLELLYMKHKLDIQATNDKQENVFHDFASRNIVRQETWKKLNLLLAQKKIDVNALNSSGKTPLDIAYIPDNNHATIVWLKAAGGKTAAELRNI